MTLDPKFKSFIQRWIEKANKYETNDLDQLFDKFFTLYVTYNALYVETTAYLDREKLIRLKNDRNFPDKKAATQYVVMLLTSRGLVDCLEATPSTKDALSQIREIMSEDKFWICLDPVSGKRKKEEDEKLREELNSSSTDERARAILKIIYQVRCNMFHGRKGVKYPQKKLLIPLVTILEKIIDKLLKKLDAPS